MKRLFLVLSLVAISFAATGCMVTTTTARVRVYEPPPQYYVYAYPNGCWADGLWYSPCPWVVGPPYGYYEYRYDGYYYRPHLRWHYRAGHPPPSHWHPRHPPHHPRRHPRGR